MMSSELHVGIVSCDASPHIGGIGRHVGLLAEGLKRRGIRVSVFSRFDRPLAFALGRNAAFSIGLQRALKHWICSTNVNLLHVHAGPGGVFLPTSPLPMIVTANHTYAAQSRLPGQRWKSLFIPWERATYRAGSHITCISPDTADSVVQQYGIDPQRVSAIPCGFDITLWQKASGQIRTGCVYVGRADNRKGFDLLMRAWRIVRSRIPDAHLTVVGAAGDDRDGIRFLGRVSDEELRACVAGARVAIVPSRLEGFGYAAAEAIAAGTPVVATDVPGLRFVVAHDVSGRLVKTDPSSIADGVISLLRDDERWRRLSIGCAHERGRFDIEIELDAMLRLYDEVYSRSTCATR